MLFTTTNTHQAIELPFNWNADYANGTNLSEFDLLTHKKNDFYSIETNKTIRFGLFGQGMKLFFEMYDGSFNLRGYRIDVEYHIDNGEILHLTNNFNKKDIITYKRCYTDLSKHQGVQKSNIESIDFGYKTNYKKNDLNVFFQPIVCMPLMNNQMPYMEVKMTSNYPVNGSIVFKIKGIEVFRTQANLLEGIAGQINWTIN